MEHRLWKTLRGKNNEVKKRISPFSMPIRESLTKTSRDQRVNFHGRRNRTFNGSIQQSVSIKSTSNGLTIDLDKKEYNPIRRHFKAGSHIDSSSQARNGSYLKLHEQNIIYGSTMLSPRASKDTKMNNFTNSKKSNQKAAVESKVLSLPRIPSSQRKRSKSIDNRNNAQLLAKHLNIIDGRRKSQSLAQPEPKLNMSSNQDVKPPFHLDTQMSLPKISIDEVLKSWDVQPTVPSRKRSPGKHDPMNFLIQQDVKKNSSIVTPANYDELKSCRYLRLDKKIEEETHQKGCPCNSCEHGQGLKESAYLNA